jgi:hypothetical protein
MLLSAGVSHAEAAPQVATRLIWDGGECGRADDFAARVMRRTRAVRFVSSGERIAVRLAIERRAQGGLDASVKIAARGRPAVTRRIQSPDCNDALDALALVVAISVEGRGRATDSSAPGAARRVAPRKTTPPASTAPVPGASDAAQPAPAKAPATTDPPALEPSTEAAPAAGAGVSETAEAPVVVEAPAPAPPAAAASAPAPPKVVAESPPEASWAADESLPVLGDARQEHLAFGGGLAAQVSLGIGPEALLGGALWVSVGWRRPGLWSPEVNLSWMYQRLDNFEDPLGDASFTLNGGSIDLCPLRIGNATFEARPCATAMSGRIVSEGHQTFEARTENRPWGAIGGTIELSARLGLVELRAAIGAAAPLVRDEYRFGGECAGRACEADVFHRVEPVIWSGALGAGVGVW